MLNSILYLKAHSCHSLTAAVKLAENNPSAKNISFANKLLEIKTSDEKSGSMSMYLGKKIPSAEKYNHLCIRLMRVEGKGTPSPETSSQPEIHESERMARKRFEGSSPRRSNRLSQNIQLPLAPKLPPRRSNRLSQNIQLPLAPKLPPRRSKQLSKNVQLTSALKLPPRQLKRLSQNVQLTSAPKLLPRQAAKTSLGSLPVSRLKDEDRLTHRLDSLRTQLLPKNYSDERYMQIEDVNRFSNIKSMALTNVTPHLNANKIYVAGKELAIASQYPKPEQIEHHLDMLVSNRIPVLVVLTTREEMAEYHLPDYFSKSKNFPEGTRTKSRPISVKNFGNNLTAKVYDLKINSNSGAGSVKVIHVLDWPDFTGASGNDLLKLTDFMNKEINKGVENGSRDIPVIHCKAGVGRTGQLCTARGMQMLDSRISLEKIISDERNSRNGHMVQTPQQLAALVQIAKDQGRPLID